MVTPDGVVKVLDFGLAGRPSSDSGASPDLSPTLTVQATQAGVLIGTAAYMAPEQASGRPVDKRADIWAFGVVVWEMITGRRMFEGETISHVLAAVLTKDPDLGAVPARVRPMLARCLEKDLKKRLRDIGDAMSLVHGAAPAGPATTSSHKWWWAGGGAIAGALAAALVVAVWMRQLSVVDVVTPLVRFQIERPFTNSDQAFSLSPEGRRLAYVPSSNGAGPYLLGIEAVGLVARAFDLATMSVSGEAFTVVQGAVVGSVSANGILATSPRGTRPSVFPTWFDRKGTRLGSVGEPGTIGSINLSPDGRKLAVTYDASRPGAQDVDIWLRDVASGAQTRITFNPGQDSGGLWSPDGKQIVFSSRRDGRLANLYQKATDGTGNESHLFPSDGATWTNDWSHDGQSVIFSTLKKGSNVDMDLWVFPMDGRPERKPVPYLDAPASQKQAQVSPDDRFVAYASDESGTWEIYVQSSWPSLLHRGSRPPPLDTTHFPSDAFGNVL